MERKKKVVFKDADRTKVAVGYVSFEEGFVKVTNDSGSTILINKGHVITIKEGEF